MASCGSAICICKNLLDLKRCRGTGDKSLNRGRECSNKSTEDEAILPFPKSEGRIWVCCIIIGNCCCRYECGSVDEMMEIISIKKSLDLLMPDQVVRWCQLDNIGHVDYHHGWLSISGIEGVDFFHRRGGAGVVGGCHEG